MLTMHQNNKNEKIKMTQEFVGKDITKAIIT